MMMVVAVGGGGIVVISTVCIVVGRCVQQFAQFRLDVFNVIVNDRLMRIEKYKYD